MVLYTEMMPLLLQQKQQLLFVQQLQQERDPAQRQQLLEQLLPLLPHGVAEDLQATPEEAASLLQQCNSNGRTISGVMVGRSLRSNPWLWLKSADAFIKSCTPGVLYNAVCSSRNTTNSATATRHDALLAYAEYADQQIQRLQKQRLQHPNPPPRADLPVSALRKELLQPLLNLFSGEALHEQKEL
ncbi:hypothetical protein cyc_05363 [Cyclospora cayetanensis]|uniref:Uncharacterized protein n=1 Tax=Cyclospora cayetanensis TaxID=88456 RepID=A0A1D3CUR6_9EIME|nr:hypothetical protein cyc_05363 [Cyclospora cayetanensis]